MFIALLFSATVHAGVVSELSPEELHLAQCAPEIEEATQKEGINGEINAWRTCLEQAQSKSLARIVPDIKGHLLEREVHRNYAALKESNPIDFAKVLLASAAQSSDTRVPFEVLQSHWLQLMEDVETRANMGAYRSAAVRFMPHASIDDDKKNLLDDHLRRRVRDLGLKAPDSNSQEAGEAPIVIQISPFFEELEPSVDDDRGRLYHYGFQLRASSIRFKVNNTRNGGFRVGDAQEDAHSNVAIDEAIDGVTIKFAKALMGILVREAFSDYPIPSP